MSVKIAVIVCAATVAAELPPMNYRYAVFNTGDTKPAAAAAFLSKYTGGKPLSSAQYQLTLEMGATHPTQRNI